MIYQQPDFSVQPRGVSVKPDDLFVCFHKSSVLLLNGAELPTWEQVRGLLPEGYQPFELAHAGEAAYFTLHPHDGVTLPETDSLTYCEMRSVRIRPCKDILNILSCWHLWSWYMASHFCGSCAHAVEPCEKERALRCPECGRLIFPTICPAIIVAITCGDRILLAQNLRASYKHYALIAGYVEVGETLEHAVRREVKEETGIDLLTLRYLDDQPWGMSGSHMFAFHATADDRQPLVMQEAELTDLRWFDRSELQPRDDSISIANVLIERFRHGEL